MTRRRLRMVPLVVYVALIFTLSSIPSLTPPGPRFLLSDKVAHLCEYFTLGVLLFTAVGWRISTSRLATIGFLLAIGVTIGALDETYQSFIPGREMSLQDWLADGLGLMLGVGVFVFTPLGRRPKEAQNKEAK